MDTGVNLQEWLLEIQGWLDGRYGPVFIAVARPGPQAEQPWLGSAVAKDRIDPSVTGQSSQ
jgi:hypothetical protein